MADLVRYLQEKGSIGEVDGQWALEHGLPEIQRELPESVRGMIERKIGQLPEDDHKLLTAASVQGYVFDSAVVAQVLDLPADDVEERLENLERVLIPHVEPHIGSRTKRQKHQASFPGIPASSKADKLKYSWRSVLPTYFRPETPLPALCKHRYRPIPGET